MRAAQKSPVRQGVKLAAATTLGLLVGGGIMVVNGSQDPQIVYREVVAPIASAQSQAEAQDTPETADEVAAKLNLTDRERAVLARLASLPDLPVVKVPAFDVKVQSAPPHASRQAAGKPVLNKTEAANPQPSGESVIARIQVVSVEKNRVFYRSVDDQMHTAKVGERLLGVNGSVLQIDSEGALLLIDGQRMRVAANNM